MTPQKVLSNCENILFPFEEHNSRLRKARNVLDALQSNQNRLRLSQRRKSDSAEAEQRLEVEAEVLLGGSEHDERTTGAEERKICKSAEQHEDRESRAHRDIEEPADQESEDGAKAGDVY